MAKSSKKLTLSAINKLNNEMNEKKVIRVAGDYEVQIDLKFRKTKVQKLLFNYYTILQDLQTREDVTEETLLQTTSMINTLIIATFSDVPIPVDLKNIENLIRVSNALIDTGIFEEVINEFPNDQIKFLKSEIDKASDNIGKMTSELVLQQVLNDMGDDEDEHNIQESE